MKKFKFTLITFLLVFVSNSYGAGFDCGKANTNVEHLICNNSSLSNLDEEMVKLYKETWEIKYYKKDLEDEQKSWRENSRNTCLTVQCLQDMYNFRIDKLKYQLSKIKQNTQPSEEQNTSQVSENQLGLSVNEEVLLSQSFPNWKSILNTREFNNWKAMQTSDINELFYSKDVTKIIKLFNLYQGKGITETKRTESPIETHTNSVRTEVNEKQLHNEINTSKGENMGMSDIFGLLGWMGTLGMICGILVSIPVTKFAWNFFHHTVSLAEDVYLSNVQYFFKRLGFSLIAGAGTIAFFVWMFRGFPT